MSIIQENGSSKKGNTLKLRKTAIWTTMIIALVATGGITVSQTNHAQTTKV
ncbi:hypothetical protein NX781_02955 [Lactobacillus kullabergensis]|uniref:hypothetical protein n=1 Tax=Lactobacillus TaxID=1578 RepID=UPI0018DCDED1|nr:MULTISPECIES: hypothetical protein [Lactobacillus]MBI0121371.1 hypothetical protein [Lactobacillus sp. M0398]MBI0123518.1 hypothetical protein [Lactobacillus sp. W8174]MBI0135852.1 hypothetical protein [Lactobacillus sp. W8173]MCX0290772.1 hypothetical protein [Lactobacillus kullabergensis]